MLISREDAKNLMESWVESPSLRRHMYSVEAAMRAYARKFKEDEELWGITGLLHDLDYEKFPNPDPAAKTGHPFEAIKYFEQNNFPEELIQAVLGHAPYANVPRESLMAKVLFASDELCGFLISMAHMRPDRLKTVTPETVRKYLNKKKFSEKVSREEIAQGIAELGEPEDTHYQNLIEALSPIAEAL